MKKIISLLAIVLMLLIATQTRAQITFGGKVGLNIANMSMGTLPSGQTMGSVTSFNLGGLMQYNFSGDMYLEAGLGLSGKGTNMGFVNTNTFGGITTSTVGTVKVTPLYLEIPINFLYKVDLNGAKLELFAGPYLAFGIGGSVTQHSVTSITGFQDQIQDTTHSINYGSDSTTADMKGFDFGLNFGAGIEYENFFLKLQYGLGLVNLSTSAVEASSLKNGVIGISVGYLFGEGGGGKKHKRRRH